MPIRLTTPLSQIDKYMEQQLKRQERALVNTLSHIGQQCVNRARVSGSYTDRTSNLRSSIGYIVAVDGKVRSVSDFHPVQGKNEENASGEDGSKAGKDYAIELVAQYPKGTVLIVVAGMHYAKYVAAKGFDVIASAELEAKQLIPRLLKQLEIEINNANGKTGTD